jgi:hypothetical protein
MKKEVTRAEGLALREKKGQKETMKRRDIFCVYDSFSQLFTATYVCAEKRLTENDNLSPCLPP